MNYVCSRSSWLGYLFSFMALHACMALVRCSLMILQICRGPIPKGHSGTMLLYLTAINLCLSLPVILTNHWLACLSTSTFEGALRVTNTCVLQKNKKSMVCYEHPS
jgi:hypothetical protein